jgi:hypothetical protein
LFLGLLLGFFFFPLKSLGPFLLAATVAIPKIFSLPAILTALLPPFFSVTLRFLWVLSVPSPLPPLNSSCL